MRRNRRGGIAVRLRTLNSGVLREALDAARSDFDVVFAPATALRYIHKVADRRHLYFFANLDPRIAESVVTLRGDHGLEAWDPHTGLILPIESKHSTRKGIDFTEVRLKLAPLRSAFLKTTQALP